MIELPSTPAPNGVTPTQTDYGLILRPATGAQVSRINRAGSRFKLDVTYPPLKADVARTFISRLLKAKRDGLRMEYPLLGVSQGSPGAPKVRGTGAAGTTLPLKGLTAGYEIKEGYWLTTIDSAGVYYLYTVTSGDIADGSGSADITIEPPLRAPLVDNNVILLATPMVEGLITSDVSWPLTPDRLIPLSFTLEEST